MNVARIITDYQRLHETVEAINATCVWEMLSQGVDPTPLFPLLPTEFQGIAAAARDRLTLNFSAMLSTTQEIYQGLRRDAARAVGFHDASIAGAQGMTREVRNEFVERTAKYPTIAAMLLVLFDGGDIEPTIWASLKPPDKVLTPYAVDSEG